MTLQLHPPFQISDTLAPSIRMGDAWIELLDSKFQIRFIGTDHVVTIDDYKPSAAHDIQTMFCDIMTFLCCWAEALPNGPDCEDYDLFNVDDDELTWWVQAYADEIACMAFDLMECTTDLIYTTQ